MVRFGHGPNPRKDTRIQDWLSPCVLRQVSCRGPFGGTLELTSSDCAFDNGRERFQNTADGGQRKPVPIFCIAAAPCRSFGIGEMDKRISARRLFKQQRRRQGMNSRDYSELFRYLMEQYCLPQENLLFVEDISAWCEKHDIREADAQKPVKLLRDEAQGCTVLVKENLTEDILEGRLNELRMRGQIQTIASDRVDLLNSSQKKLAYLFLSEYAASLTDLADDELAADNWVFEEMKRLGFFRT